MEKPQINLQWDRQSSNRPQESLEQPGDKVKIIAPVLLATVTGVLLGVCLLLLFRGQSTEPTVTTVPATTTPTSQGTTPVVKGAAQLPGQSMWTWQLASFTDQAAAQKEQQGLAAKGIHATMRQIGSTYQLLIGVAVDKKSGAALETVLKKMKIGYYAKPYSIEAKSGAIQGLKDSDAKVLSTGLAQEMKLATETMQLAQQEKPNGKAVAALKQKLDAMQEQEKGWHNTLAQGGLTGEAALLDTMHKQLADGITALKTPGNLLAAQSKLVGFYVDFESLSGQLVKSE
jgi:hypothetical protein